MNEELLQFPVPDRRGLAADDDEDKFSATLIEGDLDQVIAGLISDPNVCHIERDLLQVYFDGKLVAPTGNYAVLFSIAGSNWIHYSGAVDDNVNANCGLRVLTLGHNDTSDYCHLQVANGKSTEIAFSTIAYQWEDLEDEEMYREPDDEPAGREHCTNFHSIYHNTNWWEQFDSPRTVQNQLLSFLGAYVPLAFARDSKGLIKLDAWHEDAVEHQYIDAIAVVLFGKPRAMQPTAESHQLKKAIDDRDSVAAKKAIQAGADLCHLPNTVSAPLANAIAKEIYEDQPNLAVIQAILDAGADANVGGDIGTCNAPIFEAIACSRNPRFCVNLTKILLEHGADFNARSVDSLLPGSTPLMHAAKSGSSALVQLLLAYGADPDLTDEFGRKAADYTQWQPQGNPEKKLLQPDFAKRFLHEMSDRPTGDKLPLDFDECLEKEQLAAEQARSQQRASVQKFKQKMDALDAKLKKAETNLRRDVHQFLHEQPDRISLQAIDPIQWHQPIGSEIAKALGSLGFESAGDFCVQDVDNYLLRGFINVEAAMYAATCEITNPEGDYRHGTWVEMFRCYCDGTSDRASNAAIPECVRYLQDEGHTNEYYPPFARYSVNVNTYTPEDGHVQEQSDFQLNPLEECTRMLNEMKERLSSSKPVVSVRLDDFSSIYCECYAQDMAIMKRLSKDQLTQ